MKRRDFSRLALGGTLGTTIAPWASPLLQAATIGEDGLHKQPWLAETFLELGDDLGEAAEAGKRLVVMWEQKGCPYCRDMHEINFAKPEITDYIKKHFVVVQLNLWGSREVTDFDAEAMEEKALARRWRVNFTPTIQFFPPTAAEATGKKGNDIEVARMPGYFKPFHFLSIFEFVQEKAYETMNFQRYLQNKSA